MSLGCAQLITAGQGQREGRDKALKGLRSRPTEGIREGFLEEVAPEMGLKAPRWGFRLRGGSQAVMDGVAGLWESRWGGRTRPRVAGVQAEAPY